MAQDALYAAHADAVPLSQFSLWCTGTAVCQQLADDLLAQSVEEPPASPSRKRGSGSVVVELDMGDRLGSMRHYVPNIRVRVEAHNLHGESASQSPFDLERRMVVSATEGHPGLTSALRPPLVTIRWA
jgi:hypothetical protein